MNHPSREEWMAYLYGELGEGGQTDLEAHLHVCPECKRAVAGWRGAMGTLNAWKVPTRRSRAWLESPAMRWAAAAMVLIGVGFAGGRYSSPGVDLKAVQAALLPELRRQVQQDFIAALDVNGSELATPEQRELRNSAERFATGTVEAANIVSRRLLAGFATDYQNDRAKDKRATLALFRGLRTDLEQVARVGEHRFDQIDQLVADVREGANPLADQATQTPTP